MKKQRKPLIQKEFSQRIDGNVNVWERTMGKYDWTEWRVVKVLVKEKGKYNGSKPSAS